jgi:hypothetical protein
MSIRDLSNKLNPARFPGMSPLMAAICGFVLGESFTDPEIAEITVSDWAADARHRLAVLAEELNFHRILGRIFAVTFQSMLPLSF